MLIRHMGKSRFMDCDIVVVGASVAGASMARALGSLGYKIIVIEKRKGLEKRCAGGLTCKCDEFDWFKREKSKFVDLVSPGMRVFFEDSDRSYAVMGLATYQIRRGTFEGFLKARALDEGVRFEDGEFVNYEMSESGVMVRARYDGTSKLISCRMIAGCDGAGSRIRKKAESACGPLAKSAKDFGVSFAASVELETYGEQDDCLILLNRDRSGYSWVFPKKGCANIGVGRFWARKGRTDPRAELDEFITKLNKMEYINIKLSKKVSTSIKGALIPSTGPMSTMHSDRLLLAGDASGAVNPISGEGMYYALKQAELAKNVLSETSEFSANVLKRYSDDCERAFGRRLAWLRRIRDSGMFGALCELGEHSGFILRRLVKFLYN